MNNYDLVDEMAPVTIPHATRPAPQCEAPLSLLTSRGLKVSTLTDAELFERCEHASAKDWVVLGPELYRRAKR